MTAEVFTCRSNFYKKIFFKNNGGSGFNHPPEPPILNFLKKIKMDERKIILKNYFRELDFEKIFKESIIKK